MSLTLRNLTGKSVAFALWLMPDGSVVTTKMLQSDYDAQAAGLMKPPGSPDAGAEFLLAGGGIPALDTVDGWPAINDCWLKTDEDGSTVLMAALGSSPDYRYLRAVASDPGTGQTSQVTGFVVQAQNNLIKIPNYNKADPTQTVVPQVAPTASKTLIDVTIPNHKSVTFDAKSSGSGGEVSSLTISHVMSGSANGYICGGSFQDGSETLTSVKYNGVDLTQRLSVAVSTRQGDYWDLPGPSTGTNNMVFNYSGGTNCYPAAGCLSATGVDQATPRSHTATDNGNSGGPVTTNLSCVSAVGELVMSFLGFHTGNNTIDPTWVSDFHVASIADQLDAAHIAGAASVVRADSMDGPNEWVLLMASLKAASGGAPTTPFSIIGGMAGGRGTGEIIGA